MSYFLHCLLPFEVQLLALLISSACCTLICWFPNWKFDSTCLSCESTPNIHITVVDGNKHLFTFQLYAPKFKVCQHEVFFVCVSK